MWLLLGSGVVLVLAAVMGHSCIWVRPAVSLSARIIHFVAGHPYVCLNSMELDFPSLVSELVRYLDSVRYDMLFRWVVRVSHPLNGSLIVYEDGVLARNVLSSHVRRVLSRTLALIPLSSIVKKLMCPCISLA